jgi:hypothetical protein
MNYSVYLMKDPLTGNVGTCILRDPGTPEQSYLGLEGWQPYGDYDMIPFVAALVDGDDKAIVEVSA